MPVIVNWDGLRYVELLGQGASAVLRGHPGAVRGEIWLLRGFAVSSYLTDAHLVLGLRGKDYERAYLGASGRWSWWPKRLFGSFEAARSYYAGRRDRLSGQVSRPAICAVAHGGHFCGRQNGRLACDVAELHAETGELLPCR